VKEDKGEEAKGDGGQGRKGDGGQEEGRRRTGDAGQGRKGDGEEGKNPRPPPISRVLAIFTDREKKGLAKAIKNHFPDCSHFFCVSILRRTS
jgi:hypothetical protein